MSLFWSEEFCRRTITFHMTIEAPNDLTPKYHVNFNQRGSLSRATSPPVFMDVLKLIIFGDSSAVYLAEVTTNESSARPYARLSSIKAQSYIQGWCIDPDAFKLYLIDGFELSLWDLFEGKKLQERSLVTTDVAIARSALDNLQTATQKVEWATLLEQAEDEWVKLTAERSAVEPGSDERERLDLLAADYMGMLRSLREMTGNTAGSAGSKTLVAGLKQKLAEARKTAAPYLFSTPLLRRCPDQSHQLYVMQGNGTLLRTDKWLNGVTPFKLKASAEPQIVLLNDRSWMKEWLGYISNSTLYVHDPTSLEEKSHWSPTPAPAAGTTHTLRAGNNQFWWSTETGVYALQPNASGVLQLTWTTGAPWAIKQVGRYPIPQTAYNEPVNPNDLFDTMNVKAWIAKRSNPNAALTEGMMAQLLLSDENGKYTSPPEGKSFIITLPAAGEANTRWTDVNPHPYKPLVLVSDNRGVSTQSRYPASTGQQLVPHWTTAPWLNSLSSVTAGCEIDRVLTKPWDAPKVRPLSKPFADMIAQLWEGNPDAQAVWDLVKIVPNGAILDRHLRYVMWFALLGWDSNFVEIPYREGAHGSRKPSPFPRWLVDRFGMSQYWPRFGRYGDVFRVPDQGAAKASFRSTSVSVNFDPPWTWPTGGPPMELFHSPPPAWYDPWGYNRPGDFVTVQPSPTFLDPFCFDGHLKFPQRPVTLDGNFKGRSWAVFVDNDPADPNTLVVLTDEERQRTTLQVLPPKPLPITFDAGNRTFQQEVRMLGSISKLVVGPPAIGINAARTMKTAWCVMSPDSVSARLRKLVTYDPTILTTPWDKFVERNKARYGPTGTGKTWQIDICPLPDAALPEVVLDGYALPS